MKYSFTLIVALCVIGAINADCGCTSCSKGNLQFGPSNSNVEIIYKGQPCPCQRALPYQVEIPLNSLPESRRSYEYQVVAPPRPSPPPQRFVYNYQLQVPVPQAPQQRLNGLLARLDRVVLPAPDCRSVNPALATDANSELYSDGSDLTSINGGYSSQTVYSNNALQPNTYVSSGNGYDSYQQLSNGYGLSSNNLGVYSSGISGLNAAQQFDNTGSISLTPCDGVRGPIVEQLRYYDNDDTNDYYSRYARNANSDESDSSDSLLDNEERYIEANVPYIPDSDNLENYSLKNSDFSILEEVPSRQTEREDSYSDYDDDYDKPVRNPVYRDDYFDDDSATDSDENSIPYLSKIYGTVETDSLQPYSEALNVDNAYAKSVSNSELDTDLLYKLYLEYLGQQNTHNRRRRDLNSPPTDKTTEASLQEFLAYLADNRGSDCSVPIENRNIDLTNEGTTEQSLTTTDGDIYTTTNSDTTTESLIPTTVKNDHQSKNAIEHDQLKDLIRLFEKYNKIKELNHNKNPVSLHKFFATYPQAAKLMNNFGNAHNKQLRDNEIDVTSKYFQPPMCPTIQNLLKHPKYSAKQMGDMGVLQYLPELSPKQPEVARYLPPKQPESQQIARELYQQRIFDINGLDVGPITRKARSYGTNPKPIFGTRFLPKVEKLPYPQRKFNLQRASTDDFSEENSENNMYMRTEMSENVNQFNSNTDQLFKTSQSMQENFDMSSSETGVEKEDSTTLYKAIDLKQKLREKQQQDYEEDSKLYEKYLEIPALKKQENKYNKYFRIPEFTPINIEQTANSDLLKLHKPEIILPPRVAKTDEENLFEIEREIQSKEPVYASSIKIPPGAVLLPPGQKCKRHNTPYCSCKSTVSSPKVQFFNSISKPAKFSRINHMYDQGFGENFHNFASLKLKREEPEQILTPSNLPLTLEQEGSSANGLDVISSVELSDSTDSERFERTISFILSKLRNSRLLNYIRRKYNDRLARKLDGVVRNMDAINSLNAISSTNSETDINIGAHFTQNAGFTSNVNRFSNFNTIVQQKSKPQIVYDHLGHKYVEIDGFRRLIRPNIQKQVEVINRRIDPCVETVDIRSNQVQSSCNQNNYQNSLESEIIVETNDILQREPIYKTETIEIIKPQTHVYYPEEKFIIQQTKVDQQRPIITEEIKLSENIDTGCQSNQIIIDQGREYIQRRPCQEQPQIVEKIITEENRNIDTGCQSNQIVIDQGREYIQRRPCQEQPQIIEKIITEENRNTGGENVIINEKIIKNSSGEREVIKTIEIEEQNVVPERKIEIIEEKIIPQPVNEVIITQTVDQPQQNVESAANIEIKETIKKYQIPVINSVGCTTHNCDRQVESASNQQTVIENQNIVQNNAINEYQKLQQLQQFVNYLQVLQNQQQSHQQHSNVDLTSLNQQNNNAHLLNALLLNRLRVNNNNNVATPVVPVVQTNIQPTGSIKSFVKNSHSSEHLTDINLHKNDITSNYNQRINSLPLHNNYLGQINLQNIATNNNLNRNLHTQIHSNEQTGINSLPLHNYLGHINSQNIATNNNLNRNLHAQIHSNEETDLDVHKNTINNLNLDILKHQAALNTNHAKNFDLNLHHTNNIQLPNLLTNLGHNNLPLLNNNLHMLNNFDLHKQFNSYLTKRESNTNKDNIENCPLNPNHLEYDESSVSDSKSS